MDTSHHKSPTDTLESCVRSRHSIRFYKPDDVPEATLRDCLKLAQLAPSNSNMQNWRIRLASGAARDRVVHALRAEAATSAPQIPPLPDKFTHFRSEFGRLLYGSDGYDIPRGEKERMTEARLRNYDFFGAPTVGLLTMDSGLSHVDAMSVGMFLQTFVLALTARGLGSCLQVSVTGYPETLRKEFLVPEDQMILCGIAVGWPAEHKVNDLHVDRELLENEVVFLTE